MDNHDAEYAAFCATRDPVWEALCQAKDTARGHIEKAGARSLHRILEAALDAYGDPEELGRLSVAISMAERPVTPEPSL
jgi:hypothetical protein